MVASALAECSSQLAPTILGGEAMRQFAEKASAVVMLVLALIVTASAECPWVLWSRPLTGGARAWEPYQAFPTADDCNRAA